MAGSMGGTASGAFLISSGILNVGNLLYPGSQLIGGASVVFTGYLGKRLGNSLYNSYQRKNEGISRIYINHSRINGKRFDVDMLSG